MLASRPSVVVLPSLRLPLVNNLFFIMLIEDFVYYGGHCSTLVVFVVDFYSVW